MTKPMADDAAMTTTCETHHWVSTNVPGLLTRWVIQCSLCGAYNAAEMNAALTAAGYGLVADAKREAWDEGCEEATDHYAAHAHDPNSNGPADPPMNPYRKASNDDQ